MTLPLPIPDPEQVPTLTIEDAGRYLSISRASAYRAAAAGLIPTVQVGPRRRVVPTAALREMLNLTPVPTSGHRAA